MKILDIVVFVLVVVGGLNWGLVGLFDFNLVGFIFGQMSIIARLIYVLVGLSAVYEIVLFKDIKLRLKE